MGDEIKVEATVEPAKARVSLSDIAASQGRTLATPPAATPVAPTSRRRCS